MKIKKMIFLLILPVFFPGLGLCKSPNYTLHVSVDTELQKLSGTARLKSDSNEKVFLSFNNLINMKIDGERIANNDHKGRSLELKSDKEVLITYDVLADGKGVYIDENNVFLSHGWYPRPDELFKYNFSITLPKDFKAISEAETFSVTESDYKKRFNFQFDHPLDALNVAASTRYVPKKVKYNEIVLETYFFKESVSLSDVYLEYTKKYFEMYESLLTPFPYKRFAIVESIFPVGHSMPTFTLLGSSVIRLPFIVETSLGHEILHQWFGNSVYIDYAGGNWSEGITTYLADHYYSEIKGRGVDYRKQALLDYSAYVDEKNVIPVSDFVSHRNKAESSVGYGKSAMVFHELKKRFGVEIFWKSIREFIRQNNFQKASWHDIQRAFENTTGEKLYTEFGQWLTRKDIPQLSLKDASLRVEMGKLMLNFTLAQQDDPYKLIVPISIYGGNSKREHLIGIDKPRRKVLLRLDEPPTKVMIDDEYRIMRKLDSDEVPPVLAAILGRKNLNVISRVDQRIKYRDLIEAFKIKNISYLDPEAVSLVDLMEKSFVISGFDNPIVDILFGGQSVPETGVSIKVFKNPYNSEERIALLHVQNKEEAIAVKRKISHYGKYTELVFENGKNTKKRIAQAANGISVLSRPSPKLVNPGKQQTIESILSRLGDADVIYVGEQHDKFAHHMNQLKFIKRLREAGHKLAVGMEMFQRPYQKVVNEYLEGHIDESEFLRESEYFDKWGYNYNLYKPIIDYLKKNKIPLIALNINGEISRKVGREGLVNLTDEEKRSLPQKMNFSDEKYRKDLRRVFEFHENQVQLNKFNFFLQAQVVWDETMAETAHRFLLKNPEHKMVILAGNGHIRYKYGIPNRLYRRNKKKFIVILQDEETEEGIADYVLFTTPLEGEKSPKLGVIVEKEESGIVIKGISDGTPAKMAGLKEGDVIKAINGNSIESLSDLKLALFYSVIGKIFDVEVEREGSLVNKKVKLFDFKRFSPHFSREMHKRR